MTDRKPPPLKTPWNRIGIEALGIVFGVLLLMVVDGFSLSVLIVACIIALGVSIGVRLFDHSAHRAIRRRHRLTVLGDAFEGVANLGDRGRSRTPLVPGGKADFNGQLVDVISEGAFIDTDQPIEVVERSRNRIVVRVRRAG